MASFTDEAVQAIHMIQVLTNTELDYNQRKVVKSWLWGYEDRRLEYKDQQLADMVKFMKGR